MALDKTRLKNNLLAVYQDIENHGDTRELQADWFCDQLADVLIEEIKQLRINYTNGLTAPNGAVTGTINHTVS
jgi:hypothetical protein